MLGDVQAWGTQTKASLCCLQRAGHARARAQNPQVLFSLGLGSGQSPGQHHCWCQRNGPWARPPAEWGPGTSPGAFFLSDGSQRRVSSQQEGAQLGGDLRTAVLLKEIFVFLRKHGALQAGLVRCH